MKKYLILLLSAFIVLPLTACSKKEKLYVLNVGDYINDELLDAFEEEFDCEVVYTEVNSNEEIYQKLKNENYDICCVSDYMIDRMYQEGLIQEIDFERLDNYSADDLFSEARNLIESTSYCNYFIPYFWGTVGILYRTDDDVAELEDYVRNKGLEAIFENNEYKKGMYNSARDCLCMALMVLGEDINTPDEDTLRRACALIKSIEYRAWGDDNLKTMVHNKALDMALVYSGDYLDESYQCEVDDEEVNFGYFAPNETNVWFDGLVLTKVAQNVDLAYEFLNFFSEPETSAENADYIGYCPLNEAVYDILFDPEGDYGYDYDDELFFPFAEGRIAYKYVSDKHYNLLNDLLEESKSK